MGRLLDEDDVIDAINKRISVLQKHPEFRRKHADIDLYGIKPMIAELSPAQPTPNWIPCSERLPEKEGKYLVTDIKTVDIDIFTHSENGTPMWFLSDNATAWMPLPEPYQKGEDE